MYERFLKVAGQLGDRVSVTNENERASFAQLAEWVDKLGSLLGHGEDPLLILLMLPGGPHFTAVQLAGIAAGSVVAPISPQSTMRELERFLQLVQPDLVVAEDLASVEMLLEALSEPTTILLRKGARFTPGRKHRLLAWADLGSSGLGPPSAQRRDLPDNTFLLEFTSGSTGRPKGVLLSLGNLEAYLDQSQEFLSRFAGQDVFCPMPQFHAFGGTVVLEHILFGASVHLANTYMPGEHLKRLKDFDCSAILSAPTYLRLLLQMSAIDSRALPALRSISLGSAAIDQDLVRSLHERFDNLEVCLRYGLTETMGPICRICLKPGEDLDAPGLVGSPVPGVELASGLSLPEVGEPTEVHVRCQVVAEGQLLGRDEWRPLTDSGGFFSTGDLGYLDEKGRLHLRGRISTFIKRNGFRIDPFEIEMVLRGQAGVAEVAVLGMPDPLAGQRIVACVEAQPGDDPLSEKDLIQVCRRNLSVAKVPQSIFVMDALPRTASGKPDRVWLKDHLGEKLHDRKE